MFTRLNPLTLVSRLSVALYTGSWKIPPKDRLSSTFWWKRVIERQIRLSRGKYYQVCLLGDSITAPLKNSLGETVFNFALPAMSVVSLVEQLRILGRAHVKCSQAIVAIGTNDAWYEINDKIFLTKLKESIYLLRLMKATQIILIPAFYSSRAASQNPYRAGSITRIEEINELLRKVAISEGVIFAGDAVQVFFEQQALKSNLTSDGIHLNTQGLNLYREVLLELLKLE